LRRGSWFGRVSVPPTQKPLQVTLIGTGEGFVHVHRTAVLPVTLLIKPAHATLLMSAGLTPPWRVSATRVVIRAATDGGPATPTPGGPVLAVTVKLYCVPGLRPPIKSVVTFTGPTVWTAPPGTAK